MRAPKSESADAQTPRATRAVAVLCVIVAIGFAPAMLADFIRFDDYGHILENAYLRRPLPTGLSAFWSQPYFSLYIPITYSLWHLLAAGVQAVGVPLGQAAWAFHGLNLVLHVANSVLVFLIIRALVHRLPARERTAAVGPGSATAMMAGALFALHPAQVEAVAWVSELKDVLSALFGLLGLYVYCHLRSKYWAAALLLAAMLAKPAAIVFPGVLLLVDRVLLRRTIKESAVLPVIVWLLTLPIVVATKSFQPNLNMDFVPSIAQRTLVAADALGFYVWKLVMPYSLALDYGRSPRHVLAQMGGWRLVLPVAVSIAGFIAAATAFFRPARQRTWCAIVSCGWTIFVFSLVPVLGLVPFEYQDFSTVADRYMYVSMFGAAMVVWGLAIQVRKRPVALATLAIVVVTTLAVSTFRQASRWRSTETLFAHTLTINRSSYLAHYSIAAEKMGTGRLDEGIRDTRLALAIKPDFLPALVALGTALLEKGLYEDAIIHYTNALTRHPDAAGKRAPLIASIHNNLGMALHQVGRHAEGTAHFRSAVEVDPKSVNGHVNLGRAALNEGRYLEAVSAYERALSLTPGDRSLEQSLMRARRAARNALMRTSSP